ncbi:MAG: hypothetical protein ACRDT8_22260 [Micromonosporaceae bacterium]
MPESDAGRAAPLGGARREQPRPSPARLAAPRPSGDSEGAEPAPPHKTRAREGGGRTDRDPERGLRGLVGAGSSQVGVWAAARARDASRPTDEDLATAEAQLRVVRRNWVPREPFRPGGRPDRAGQ